MSNLSIKTLTSLDPITNLIEVSTGDTLYNPGSVVQVIQTAITTPTALAVAANVVAYNQIPDFNVTIIPKKQTSRFYIVVNWFGEFSNATLSTDGMWGLLRNGTPIGVNPNTTASSRGITASTLSYWTADAATTPETAHFDYLDAPNTVNPITYQVSFNTAIAATVYTNRTLSAGASNQEYGTSTITVWEIAQ